MVKLILGLLIAVALILLLVRLAEPRLAFFPVSGETVTPRQFGIEYSTVSVVTSDGEQLRGWVLAPAADPPRAEVIYFHGNGGNLSIWAPILAGVARQGYSVIAFDYRGYGKSTGRPTERGLYRDVDAVIDRLRAVSSPRAPLIYWGRSLGVTMAAYAATVRRPDGLILEAGFPDVGTLFRGSPLMAILRRFSTYRFPASSFLQEVSSRTSDRPIPMLVMHGDHDRIIPIAQGRLLFDRITGPKRFFTISGGDHNDASPPNPRAYWEAVDEFIGGL